MSWCHAGEAHQSHCETLKSHQNGQKLEKIDVNYVMTSRAEFQVFQSSLENRQKGGKAVVWLEEEKERETFFPFNIERRCCYVTNWETKK